MTHSIQEGNLVDKQAFNLTQKNWILDLEQGLVGQEDPREVWA